MTWEKEIRELMYDFCMGNHADRIISDVKSSAKGNESAEVLYDRAWNKFKSTLLAQEGGRQMRKYTYRFSAYGRMRDRKAEKGNKGKSRMPYKTIMWQTS